jgi:hypothetical protein
MRWYWFPRGAASGATLTTKHLHGHVLAVPDTAQKLNDSGKICDVSVQLLKPYCRGLGGLWAVDRPCSRFVAGSGTGRLVVWRY